MMALAAGLVFAAGWGALVMWAIIFALGMGFNDGWLRLNMNTLHEGWAELGFFIFLVVVYPLALRYFWTKRDSP